jgi:hypothetical protein
MRQQHRGRLARKSASALAAMTVIVLGTPAIALAGTIGSGSGQPSSGPPGQVALACPRLHGKPVRVKVHPVQFKLHAKIARLPRNVRIRVFCRLGPGCPPAPLRFDMASGSSTMTEVSGPVLAPPEQFAYDGQIYTIMSVNPGAGTTQTALVWVYSCTASMPFSRPSPLWPNPPNGTSGPTTR